MKKLWQNANVRFVICIIVPLLIFAIGVTAINIHKSRAQRAAENSEETSSFAFDPDAIIVDPNASSETSSEKEESSGNPSATSDPDSSALPSEESSVTQESSDKTDSEETSEASEESGEESSEDSSEESSGESSDSSGDSESSGSDESSEESSSKVNTDGMTAYLLRVNKATNVITVFTFDEYGKYTIPVRAMICSTGPNTPEGTFTMSYQASINELILDEWGMYVAHITGDYLFHSVPYMIGSYGGIDHSSVNVYDYNNLGTSASHGCVRVTCGDAYWIYLNCSAYETLIEIGWYDSDPLGKPTAIKLPTDSATNWDPTDPSSENPWNDKKPYFTGVPEAITIEQGSSLPDLKDGVTAYDTCYNEMYYFSISGEVDVNTPGTYEITYYATDALGRTGYAYTTVTVTPVEESSGGEESSESSGSSGDSSESSGESSEPSGDSSGESSESGGGSGSSGEDSQTSENLEDSGSENSDGGGGGS